MKFYTLADAYRYVRNHAPAFRKRLQVVEARHWSMDLWAFIPCYTVVFR